MLITQLSNGSFSVLDWMKMKSCNSELCAQEEMPESSLDKARDLPSFEAYNKNLPKLSCALQVRSITQIVEFS